MPIFEKGQYIVTLCMLWTGASKSLLRLIAVRLLEGVGAWDVGCIGV